jgi:UDP-N-acetylmuramoylalanine-D-glutamate ligase
VISEIEFAAPFTKAVTGDRKQWKTTTTMLTYHLLKSAGLNIGLETLERVLLCKLLMTHTILTYLN